MVFGGGEGRKRGEGREASPGRGAWRTRGVEQRDEHQPTMAGGQETTVLAVHSQVEGAPRSTPKKALQAGALRAPGFSDAAALRSVGKHVWHEAETRRTRRGRRGREEGGEEGERRRRKIS